MKTWPRGEYIIRPEDKGDTHLCSMGLLIWSFQVCHFVILLETYMVREISTSNVTNLSLSACESYIFHQG